MRSLANIALDLLSLVWLIPASIARLFGSDRTPVLVFHRTSPGDDSDRWNVTPERFGSTMDQLKRGGWEVLPVTQMLERLSDKKVGRVCCITFDDGYADNVEHVVPLLSAYDFAADMYVSTNHIGTKRPHDPWKFENGETDEAHLPITKSMCDQLANAEAVGLHSHAADHVFFHAMPSDEMRAQVSESLSRLGDANVGFVVPYGVWGEARKRLVQVVNEAGVDHAFLGAFGRVSGSSNRMDLPRIPIMGSDHRLRVFLKLNGGYDWLGPVLNFYHTRRVKRMARG